jgi:uncharacterized protein (DUF58 family)
MRQTSGLRWLFFGMVVYGLTGWAVTGSVVYGRLAYLGILIIAGAGLWTLLSMRGIHLVRHARSLRASMGQVFEEHFEIRKENWPPSVWLEVINQTNLPVAGGSRLLTGIGSQQRRYYTSRTMLYRRGAFLLGPTTMSSGDPFGLFTIHRQVPATDTLIVLPMAVPIKYFPPPPGILPGGKAVRQRSSDVTPHAAGVREYVPGDPMKRIHWPTTAHRGRFMVKEFEQDPQADIWIFLDAKSDIQISTQDSDETIREEGWWLRRPKVNLPRDTFEYAICAAASLANYFLLQRRSVGLACAAGRITHVPAEKGERQVTKIMETLAFLQPIGKLPLIGLINMQAKLLPIGAGIIIITPSLKPELFLAVEDLQHRSLRPIVVLIKPDTFGGSASSETITAGLHHRHVPVCSIGYGDDLSVKLAIPVVYFQKPYYSATFSGNRD